MTANQVKTEIARIIAKAKEINVFVTDVPSLDGSGESCVSLDHLKEIVVGVSEKVPATAFMIITAGDTKCQAIVYKGSIEKLQTLEWLASIGMTIVDAGHNYGELLCADHSSLKKKDELISQSFVYLRKNGLLEEHDVDSGDDMPNFDWEL